MVTHPSCLGSFFPAILSLYPDLLVGTPEDLLVGTRDCQQGAEAFVKVTSRVRDPASFLN